MKNWMHFPRSDGRASRQAHCDLPTGTYEREFGREGFFGPVSHIHHAHPPTGWTEWEGDLKPRAFDLTLVKHPALSPWQATPIMHNHFMRLRLWRLPESMPHLAANGDGDELIFVHDGEGDLYCDFGHMEFTEGDYIVLPRGLMWRVECKKPCVMLLIEATNDGYRLPDKGLVGPNAIFDPAALQVPALDAKFQMQQGNVPWKVIAKRHNKLSTITYPYNPLDAVGWHGDNLPARINWRDIRPLMSARYHLPPSAHTTFLANRFVVCTFAPRPFESDPQALKVPFYHSNNDFDEILFYHKGNFFSRDNIHPGMMTLHPCGFPHGPHPKAMQNAFTPGKPETDEVAVMIDTRDAVEISDDARRAEWKEYVYSWKSSPA